MNPGMMGDGTTGDILPPTLNLKLFQEQGDQIDYSNYDRLLLNNAGGAIERRFFEIGLGQTDPISTRRKTYADTDMREGGKIAEGQAFAGFALKFFAEFNANLTEAQYLSWIQWLRDTVIQIDIDTKKEYGTWKLSELLGMPTNGLIVPATAGNNVALLTTGMHQGLKPLNLYIPFPRLTSFTFAMFQGTTPAAALDNTGIVCSIVGIKNRAG